MLTVPTPVASQVTVCLTVGLLEKNMHTQQSFPEKEQHLNLRVNSSEAVSLTEKKNLGARRCCSVLLLKASS